MDVLPSFSDIWEMALLQHQRPGMCEDMVKAQGGDKDLLKELWHQMIKAAKKWYAAHPEAAEPHHPHQAPSPAS